MHQVHHLEGVVGNKEQLIGQMQKSHDEQLEKLASVAEERSKLWQQQKAEIEQHYGQLLSEIHTRHQVRVYHLENAVDKVGP